ncbi:MAG TPA: ATP-binding protein [Gemmatimonadales bacterium]|nr:ATP-binding protein [Gemmatimonadales bacterium]
MSTSPTAVDLRLLLLPPTRRDAEAMERILNAARIPRLVCRDMAHLSYEIGVGCGAVLVAEELVTAEPDRLIGSAARQPVWSDFSTIVLSRSGSESPKLTTLLSRLGNVSVLERPVRITTFLTLVQSALRGRRRQYEVRDRLRELEIANDLVMAGEAALRRSRDAFATLLDSAPFGVYVVDSQFRMYLASAGSAAAFANVQPLIGRDFGEVMRILWPESFAQEAVTRFRHTLETGEPYVAPTLVEERADVGAVESYEWQLHRVRLPDDQYGVVCYFYDSTKLRHVERNLREARRKVEAAMLAGEVGIYYWDIVADRLSGDANFVSMFGLDLDPQGYAPLDEFVAVIHPDDQDSVRRQVARTLEQDAPFRAEYRIMHPAGERWVIARGMVERTRDNAAIGWAGVVVDITDRKRIEEERRALLERERAARADAERAGRIKDEFLATLSHELRTPLSAILGWSEVLKRQQKGNPDLEQGLQTIERNARAQTRIIEDLLDMSRIISGKVRLDVQRSPLSQAVRAAVDTIRPTADAKAVTLAVAIDAPAALVSGDPNRLQQIFWNLLSNAVKFTPQNGHVRVALVQRDHHVLVSVSDTGEGIDSDFLPLVFDRFRQADASTTRFHGGLGLGLAIVKQLVELHGGSITARSAGRGHGATFVVELPIAIADGSVDAPVAEVEPVVDPPRPRALESGDIRGLRVLIVDDEADSRSLVQRVLEGAGAEVVTAGSVAEAVDRFERFRPDLMISDIGMPQEDGYSLIRRIRDRLPADGGETAAIALTAYARAEDREHALAAGFHEHVVKPVEPARLVAVVAAVAGRERAVSG